MNYTVNENSFIPGGLPAPVPGLNRTFFKKAPVSVPNIFFNYFKYLYGRLRECHNEIT